MTTTVTHDTRPDTALDTRPDAVLDRRPDAVQDQPAARTPGLGAELRESLLLLGFAVGVTVGLTTAAQAAIALLG